MAEQERALPEVDSRNGSVPGYRLVPPQSYGQALTRVFGKQAPLIPCDFLVFEPCGGERPEPSPMTYSDFTRLYKNEPEGACMHEPEVARLLEPEGASLHEPEGKEVHLRHLLALEMGRRPGTRDKDWALAPALEDDFWEYADAHGPLFGTAGAVATCYGTYIVESLDDWSLAYEQMRAAVELHLCAHEERPGEGGGERLPAGVRRESFSEQGLERDVYSLSFEERTTVSVELDGGRWSSLAMRRISDVRDAIHETLGDCELDLTWRKESWDGEPRSITVELTSSRVAGADGDGERDGRSARRQNLHRLFRAVASMNLADIRAGFPRALDPSSRFGLEFGSALSYMWYELTRDGENVGFGVCEHCGALFPKSSGHKKRFCGDICRAKHAKALDKPVLEAVRRAFKDKVTSYAEVYELAYGCKLDRLDEDSRRKMNRLDTMIGNMLDKPMYRKLLLEGACATDSPVHEELQKERALEALDEKASPTLRQLFVSAYRRKPGYGKGPQVDVGGLYENLAKWLGEYLGQGKRPNGAVLEKLRGGMLEMCGQPRGRDGKT